MNEINESILPNKYWYTLSDCCRAKGINYKTACNKTILQPLQGKIEAKIGGRKCYSRNTVLEWLTQTDAEILGGIA